MDKISLKPVEMVGPVPVAMVTCGSTEEDYNIITIAWTGIVNSEPPMTYIAVREPRYSYGIIKRDMEFVINLFGEELIKAADYCGTQSGRDVNKFKETGLTAGPAKLVRCPVIKEAPINVECKVKEILHYPSHHVFVAEIVAIQADPGLTNKEGELDVTNAGLVCFNNDEYYGTFPLVK